MEYSYSDARRLGERCYREKVLAGEYPYLQVLEEITRHSGVISEQHLGIQEIPIDLIAGTYAAGRHTAFAANFMPLMNDGTEFAAKYRALMQAHEKEGIHDPVKVYEYLHRYYAVEGNKRISVLKLFGAVSAPADVTRLIPARSEDPEIRVYFEFLQFYKVVPVNYLIFSEPGDYEAFLKLTGFSAENPPEETDLLDLHASFMRFKSAYESLGGDKLPKLTDGDAYLLYLNIYGYRETLDSVPEEIRKNLEKIWDEFELHTKQRTVELVMTAESGSKKSLLERIFSPEKELQIAFIYEKTPETLSWTYSHELGRAHIDEHFKGRIQTKTYENADEDGRIDDILEEAVSDGADIIFATSAKFLSACLKAAVRFPEVKILCCALNFAHRYIRTYYARTYEAKFVSGVIAGAMADNNKIGYLADCPFNANIINLNAFANGVKMVNPRASIHVVWTDEIGADPEKTFWNEGISIISGRELITPVNEYARDFGLYRYTDSHEVESLAMTLWNWGVIYQKIIESIQDGNWEDVDKKSNRRALNYFWGFNSEAIELIINKSVPDGVARLARFLASSIKSGAMTPFYGILRSQEAVISSEVKGTLPMKDLTEMNWLLDNIVGHIPTIEDLRPEGRALMMVQGTGKTIPQGGHE